jgi:hypothetical protein
MNQALWHDGLLGERASFFTARYYLETWNAMRHLTRIVGVPFGVNILGLLELFALLGSVVGFGILAANISLPPAIGGPGMAAIFAGIVGFDIWWRTNQPEESLTTRLLSPYTGGCFGFAPIWLVIPIGVVVGGVALIVKLSR